MPHFVKVASAYFFSARYKMPSAALLVAVLTLCITALSIGIDGSSSGSSASGSWGSSSDDGGAPPPSDSMEHCPALFNGPERLWIDAVPSVTGLAIVDGTGTNYSNFDGVTFATVNITVHRNVVVVIRNVKLRRVRIRHPPWAKEGAYNVSLRIEDSTYCANMPLIGFYEIMTNVSATFVRSSLSFLGGAARGMIGTHISNPRVTTMYQHVALVLEQCSILVVSHASGEEPISVVTFTARYLRFVSIEFNQCDILVYFSATDLTQSGNGLYMVVYLGSRVGETLLRNQTDLSVRLNSCNISVRAAIVDVALADPAKDDLLSSYSTHGQVVRLSFPNATVSQSVVAMINSSLFVTGSANARFLYSVGVVNTSVILVHNATFRTLMAGPTALVGMRMCILVQSTLPIIGTRIAVTHTNITFRFMIGSTTSARSDKSGFLGGTRAIGISVERLINTTILLQSTSLVVESIAGGAFPTVVNEFVSGLLVSDADTSYISECTIQVASCTVRLNITSFCPPKVNRTILISSLFQVPITTNSAAQTVNTGVVIVVPTFVSRTRIDVEDTMLLLQRLPQGCTPQGSWFPFPFTLGVGSGLVAMSSLVVGQKQLRPMIDFFGPLFASLNPIWTKVNPQIREQVEIRIRSSRVDSQSDLFERIQESWEASPLVEFGISVLLLLGLEVQGVVIRLEGTDKQEMPFLITRYASFDNATISIAGGSTSGPLALVDNVALKNSIGASIITISGVNAKLHSRMMLWPFFHQMPWFIFFRNVSFSALSLHAGDPLALRLISDGNAFQGGRRLMGSCAASPPFVLTDSNSADPLLDVCKLGVIETTVVCSQWNGAGLESKDVGMLSDACVSVMSLNSKCGGINNAHEQSTSVSESAPRVRSGAPVAIAVAKPLSVVSLVGALAASLSTLSGALYFGRSVGVIRASQCNSIDDLMRSRVDIFSSPTQLSIAMFPSSLDGEGTDNVPYGGYVVGGVVGNVMVCLVLVCLAVIAASLLAWRRDDTASQQSVFQTFIRGLAMVRFPGVTVSVVSPLLQSTVTLCCNIFDAVRSVPPTPTAGNTHGVLTLAVITMVVVVGWCFAVIATIVVPSLFGATAISASHHDKETSPLSVFQKALQLLDRYGRRTWRWRNALSSKRDSSSTRQWWGRRSFVQHMGLFFEDCKKGRHWWLAVDLSSAMVLGITNGITPATPEACAAVIAINITVCVLLASLVLLLRPMDSKLNSHLQLFNVVMNILIAILSITERTVSTAAVLSLVVGAISMVGAVLSAIALLRIIVSDPLDSIMKRAPTMPLAVAHPTGDATSLDRAKRGALLHSAAVGLTEKSRRAPAHVEDNATVRKALETLIIMACERCRSA